MPLIMSLEGPKLGGLAAFLPGGREVSPAGFDPMDVPVGATPSPYPFMPGQLGSPLTPFHTHAAWTIGGLLLGLWLAGTSPGQGLVARARTLYKRSK